MPHRPMMMRRISEHKKRACDAVAGTFFLYSENHMIVAWLKKRLTGEKKSSVCVSYNFCAKISAKSFFADKRLEIREILRKLCERKGEEIIEGEVCPDHIHILGLCRKMKCHPLFLRVDIYLP